MGSKKMICLGDLKVTSMLPFGDLTVGTLFRVPLLWDGEITIVMLIRIVTQSATTSNHNNSNHTTNNSNTVKCY